jgi:copper chaperone CopZ
MENSKTFKVPNIGCNGCVRTIQSELSQLPGVKSVKADAATKMVSVVWDDAATWEAIEAKLVEIEYPPAK